MASSLRRMFERKTRKSTAKYIYYFDEGTGRDQGLLGYKGASLCELKRLGINVPTGFILSSELCKLFYQEDVPQLPINLVDECVDAVHELERQTGRRFDLSQYAVSELNKAGTLPLLLSVRCAAAIDIPGLTPTVLNLGMNSEVVKLLARDSRNLRWAYDSYRRFLQSYGTAVLNIDEQLYEDVLQSARSRRGVSSNTMLNASDLMYVVEEFKNMTSVPDDPWEQLTQAIHAMLISWKSQKAEKYRDLHNIPFELGNAVVVQSMVFGNLNMRSGVGKLTSRNPITGDKEMQGYCSKVSAGDENLTDSDIRKSVEDLSVEQPDVYRELHWVAKKLENHFHDVQDIEFTIEDGVLFVLEARKADRTPIAALRFATALANERVLNEREAVMSVDPKLIRQFVHPMLDPQFAATEDYQKAFIGQAQRGNGGVVTGKLVLSAEEVEKLAGKESTILCVEQLTWSDEKAAQLADGLIIGAEQPRNLELDLARQYNKSMVTGLMNTEIKLVPQSQQAPLEGNVLREGDIITIDGSSGVIFRGAVPTIDPLQNRDFQNVMRWAEKYKTSLVKCSASTYEEVDKAVEFGAEGVGLYFLDGILHSKDCIGLFRRLLLADGTHKTQDTRDLEGIMRGKIHDLYILMQAKKVVLRLVNGPLSAFFPNPMDSSFEHELKEISDSTGVSLDVVRSTSHQYHELNPTMGCRGSRLQVVKQNIARLQARAITGAVMSAKNEGVAVTPYIAVPWICGVEEMEYVCRIIQQASHEYLENNNIATELHFGFGAMIEVPRACLQAEKIIRNPFTDFVWFNTDSLTEMVFGLSRPDQHRFMDTYRTKGIIYKNPFHSIDQDSVGKLLRAAVDKCKEVKPEVKTGVYGEHCGDRASVDFFTNLGVDILICSNANHIPVAKLVSAQSHITGSPGMQRFLDTEMVTIDPRRSLHE